MYLCVDGKRFKDSGEISRARPLLGGIHGQRYLKSVQRLGANELHCGFRGAWTWYKFKEIRRYKQNPQSLWKSRSRT